MKVTVPWRKRRCKSRYEKNRGHGLHSSEVNAEGDRTIGCGRVQWRRLDDKFLNIERLGRLCCHSIASASPQLPVYKCLRSIGRLMPILFIFLAYTCNQKVSVIKKFQKVFKSLKLQINCRVSSQLSSNLWQAKGKLKHSISETIPTIADFVTCRAWSLVVSPSPATPSRWNCSGVLQSKNIYSTTTIPKLFAVVTHRVMLTRRFDPIPGHHHGACPPAPLLHPVIKGIFPNASRCALAVQLHPTASRAQ